MKRMIQDGLRVKSVCGFVLLLLGLAAGSALAVPQTYYVAPTPTGVDAGNSLGSSDHPWATISNALKHCAAVGGADTINVAAGTYTLSASLNLASNVTIQGTDAGAPGNTIINGNYVNGAVVTPCLNITTNVTINNLTITGGTNSAGTGAGFYVNGGNPSQPTVFSNCWFTNNVAGALVNSQPAGIGSQPGSAGCAKYSTAFYSCLFARNAGNALYLYPQNLLNEAYTFSNCVFTWNQSTNGTTGGAALGTYNGSQGTNIARVKITGCVFSNNVAYTAGAGAIYCPYSNWIFTVTNSAFVTNGVTIAAHGGAVVIGAGTISSCGFTNNYSALNYNGGAINITLGAGASNAMVTVQNCSFSNNWSGSGYGGAISMQNSSTAIVVNCSFVANTCSNAAGTGYGGALDLLGTAIVSNCTFIGNCAGTLGGAIWVGNSLNPLATINIYGCTFTSNSAVNGGASSVGGAIYCITSTNSLLIQNCRFLGNVLNGSLASRGGGAIFFAAGLLSNPPVVRNCLIAGNASLNANGFGGGISANGPCVLDSCTIVKNSSTYSASGGGLSVNAGVTVTMTNCIVYSNSCPSGSYSNFCQGASSTNTAYYCCLQETNGMGTTYSTNNCQVGKYPQFVNAGTGYGTNLLNNTFNFQLLKNSPCIDAGTNETWMLTGGVTDQTGANQVGNPRVSGLAVDIGCYEYVAPLSIGTSIFFR